MSDKNFKKGDRVRYIPSHAKGDGSHKDCQEGVVKRVTDEWVFVIYDNLMCIMVTGEEKIYRRRNRSKRFNTIAPAHPGI